MGIVTGSARGFGKEFAIRLLRRGAKVTISDVDESAGQESLKELQKTFGEQNVHFVKCDVTKEDDWKQLWSQTEEYFKSPASVLVNNAGVNPGHGWKLCLDIMLTGVAYGTYMALDKMEENGGRVINVASMAGLFTGLGKIEDCGYTMAKWGVVGLTRSFETCKPNPLQTHKVKSWALCPWFADTQLVRSSLPKDMTMNQFARKVKTRVLTVQEVGNGFEKALDLDNNGSIYTIFPDAPLLDFPNPNYCFLIPYVLIASLCEKMGLKMDVLTYKHLIPVAFLAFLLIYYVLGFICCLLF